MTCAVTLGTLSGEIEVRLYFGEIYFGAGCPGGGGAGNRVFDIVLEGETVLENLNLEESVGFATAAQYSFTVDVHDGFLDIDLPIRSASSLVAAIEVAPIALAD